jgi:hypothetical protein
LNTILTDLREPLRVTVNQQADNLYIKVYNSLRNILRYIIAESPESVAILEPKFLTACLQLTTPSTDEEDEMSLEEVSMCTCVI